MKFKMDTSSLWASIYQTSKDFKSNIQTQIQVKFSAIETLKKYTLALYCTTMN